MDGRSPQGWIGVDLDGTLAEHTNNYQDDIVGKPIPRMLFRVRQWVSMGIEVRIFTARASNSNPHRDVSIKAIKKWCLLYVGQELTITAEKDFSMVSLWDDRAIQVESNTGRIRADGWKDE